MHQLSQEWLPNSLDTHKSDLKKKKTRTSSSKGNDTEHNRCPFRHEIDHNHKIRQSSSSENSVDDSTGSYSPMYEETKTRRDNNNDTELDKTLVIQHRLQKSDNPKSTCKTTKGPKRTTSSKTGRTVRYISDDIHGIEDGGGRRSSSRIKNNTDHSADNPKSIPKTTKGSKRKSKRTVRYKSDDIYGIEDGIRQAPPQKILIDVNDSSNRDNCGSCLLNRKVIMLIIIYSVIATGLWSMFFQWSWSLPGKQKQIDDLTEQVDLLGEETKDLEEEVGRLEIQVSTLSNETDRLELINTDLKITAQELNETVSRYQAINQNTSDAIDIYQELNSELSKALAEAEDINNILSDTITALDLEVTSLRNLQFNLTSTINALEDQNSEFSDALDLLQTNNEQAREQIEQLENEVNNLENQNSELAQNKEHLVSILAFMTQTGIDLNTTIDDLTVYLGKEITENTALVLLSLEHSYQNVYRYWTATGLFDDLFEKKVWFINKDEPIGDDYSQLMEYIEDHIVSEVCADKEDFEKFLVNSPEVVSYDDLSFRSIRSGIERYFSFLMNHYFSSNDNEVSQAQWSEAMFDCKNLPDELRYKYFS